jgi:hypothetical protein
MNIYFPDSLGIGKRTTRAILFVLLSCVLSIFYVFMENVYAPKLSVYAYNPITLYALTFLASSVLFACAFAVIASRSKKLSVLTAVISAVAVAALSFVLGASPVQMLFALAFLPSGIIISLCISRGCEKAHTVVGSAVITALVVILGGMMYIYSSLGEVSGKALTFTVDIFRQAFVDFYGQYLSQPALAGIDVNATFDMFVAITPALFCIVVSIVSYISVTLSRALILGQGAVSDSLTRWPLKMSRLASVVFIIALVVSMLSFSGTSEAVIISMYNVLLILSPGFFLIGIRTSLLHFRRPSLFSIIIGVIVIVSCLNNPLLLVMLVASTGAFDNLFPGVRAILYGEYTKKSNS